LVGGKQVGAWCQHPIGRSDVSRSLGSLVRRLGIADPVYLVTGGHVLNLSTLTYTELRGQGSGVRKWRKSLNSTEWRVGGAGVKNLAL